MNMKGAAIPSFGTSMAGTSAATARKYAPAPTDMRADTRPFATMRSAKYPVASTPAIAPSPITTTNVLDAVCDNPKCPRMNTTTNVRSPVK